MLNGIFAIKFDSSVVTETVKADIRKNVDLIEGIPQNILIRSMTQPCAL